MSLIKIIANGVQLNYVKDSLTLKVENNNFSTVYKVKHNSFPFLIIDDENAKKVLGTNDMTSLNKQKTVEVEIYELDEKYYGEIRQISFSNGFRKADLKYGSELLKIANKKISEFMPVFSVIPGDTNPIPYSENEKSNLIGNHHWSTFPINILTKNFPETTFQFPTLLNSTVYQDSDITLYEYNGITNEYNSDLSVFKTNTVLQPYYNPSRPPENKINKHVPSLQNYLFAPLYYALKSIGFSAEGAAYEHEFLKKLLIFSNKNNLTNSSIPMYYRGSPLITYSWQDIGNEYEHWQPLDVINPNASVIFTEPPTYNYFLEYEFKIQPNINFSLYYSVTPDNTGVENWVEVFSVSNSQIEEYRIGKLDLTIDFNFIFTFKIISSVAANPVFSYVNFAYALKDTYFQFHTTIETGRYLPDWTFGKYLNELQKTFNLEIKEDNFNKKVGLNFIENEYFVTPPLVLDKTFKYENKDIVNNDSFVLKYKNDTDLALLINKDAVLPYKKEDNNLFSVKIESEFKEGKFNTTTAIIDEELISKPGTSLMVYDPGHKPYVKNKLGVFNLSISLPGGLYDVFYKKTLKIRLLATGIDVEGAFTKTELSKIKKAKTIYFDNQRFVVLSYEYAESTINYFTVKLKLETITF